MRKERRVGADAACGGISQYGGIMMILHCPARPAAEPAVSDTQAAQITTGS